MELIKKNASLIATLAISVFGIVSLMLAATDSLTYDERAHIPAAYSYVRYGDIRLNPEHPPLLKDLAGLPLLFLEPQFPLTSPEWERGPNEQWAVGDMFLNCTRPELACNNTWALTFWSRVPLIFVSLLLALFLFWWSRALAGPLAGLLAVSLMITDPNILAHNHLVTTDVGIAAAMFVAFYFFLRFLKFPSWKNTFLAGFFFALVQLVKFSGVLLFPLFFLFLVLYALILPLSTPGLSARLRVLISYLAKATIIFMLYALLVYIMYYFHTLGTPPEHLVAIAYDKFPDRELGPLARSIVEYTSSIAILKPYAAYLLGVLMVFGRVAGGNTHYFLGTVETSAQISYFPIVFLTKETLPFLLLLSITFGYSFVRFWRNSFSPTSEQESTLRARFIRHIDALVILTFVILYSILSIFGNLNIGFRHLFPILPFLYLWIAKTSFTILRDPRLPPASKTAFGYLVVILLAVQLLIPILSYPNYLSYYNELAGGTKNGYRVATDSNYDWGQDLSRLQKFIQYHNQCSAPNAPVSTFDCTPYLAALPPIDTIRVDYFGGEDAKRVLGTYFEGWWSERPPEPGWYALSINTLQENWTTHSNTLGATPPNYLWLKEYTPVARAGQSLFIYYIP